ncbi:MAG: hypothetical protein JSR77_03450 [Planctomycetes bacterium]|nr:hypothetical protein [Planctomycetota bacterium]
MILPRLLISLASLTLVPSPAWALAPAHCAADPDAKFQIESILREMAAACTAGDTDGYLAHVSSADREFRNEQKYFANDLKKKPAAECAFTVGELKIGDGLAEGPFTMQWTMPGKKERSLTFDARFLQEDGVWKFAGETWDKHEAPGVLVLCDPGLDELAGRVIEAFNAIRAHVEEGFMLQEAALPKRTQKIKLYGSMKHLQASICLSYSDGLSGWNEPGEAVKILANTKSGVQQLRPLLAHEYGHVATFELGPKSNHMPWWVLEGVADLSAEKWGSKPDGIVKAWAKAKKLAAWNDLADFETVEGKWRGHVYKQGQSMLDYVSDRFGREGRVKWLTAMSQGDTLDDATKKTLGLSFEELDNQWRAEVERAANEASPPEGAK